MMSCSLPSSIMFTCALLIRCNLAHKRQLHQPTVRVQGEKKEKVHHSNRVRDQQVIVYVITVIPLMVFYIYNAVMINVTNKSAERIAIERFCGFIAEVMIFTFPACSFFLYTLTSITFRNELMCLLRSALACKWLMNNHRIESMSHNVILERTVGDPSRPMQIDGQQGNINHATTS